MSVSTPVIEEDQLQHIHEAITHIGWDGKPLTRPSMDFLVFLAGTRHENKTAIENFFSTSLRLITKKPTHFWLDNRGKARKVKSETYSIVDNWYAKEASEDVANFGLHMVVTDDSTAAATHAVTISRLLAGPIILRLQLPIADVFALGIDNYRDTLLDALQSANILFGKSGFGYIASVNFKNTALETNPVYAWSRRYLGLELGDPYEIQDWMLPDPMRWQQSYITSVNWLTLLSAEKIKRLGGIDDLRTKLHQGENGKAIQLFPLAKGFAIQAGEVPRIGDVNKKESLAAYQQVGRCVKPLNIPKKWLMGYDGIGGEENTASWLARFDK